MFNGNQYNNIVNYSNNNVGNKYIAINTISSYISQILSEKEYNTALNTYSELLQNILTTILAKTIDYDDIQSIITNLINNETNIHAIIVYTIQMLNEKNLHGHINTSLFDDKSLVVNISQINNVKEALLFIRKNQKYLYSNCNFKNFLIKIIELNLRDFFLNTMNKENVFNWKTIFEEIINNYQYNGNNIYLVNTIWYQELKIIYALYSLVNNGILYTENDNNQKNASFNILNDEIEKLRSTNKHYIEENNKLEANNSSTNDKLQKYIEENNYFKDELENYNQQNTQELLLTQNEIEKYKKEIAELKEEGKNKSLIQEKMIKENTTLKYEKELMEKSLLENKNRLNEESVKMQELALKNVNAYNYEISELQKENNDIRKKYNEIENQCKNLEAEKVIIEKTLNEKEISIKTLERKIESIIDKNKENEIQLKVETDENIDKIKETFNDANQELKIRVEFLKHTNQLLESENDLRMNEIEILRNEIKDFETKYKNQIEELTQKNIDLYNEYEKTIADTNNSYQDKITEYKEDVKNYTHIKDKEIQKLEFKMNSLKNQYMNQMDKMKLDRENILKEFVNIFDEFNAFVRDNVKTIKTEAKQNSFDDFNDEEKKNRITSLIKSVISTMTNAYNNEKNKFNRKLHQIIAIINDFKNNGIIITDEENITDINEEDKEINILEKYVNHLLKIYLEIMNENEQELNKKLLLHQAIEEKIQNINYVLNKDIEVRINDNYDFKIKVEDNKENIKTNLSILEQIDNILSNILSNNDYHKHQLQIKDEENKNILLFCIDKLTKIQQNNEEVSILYYQNHLFSTEDLHKMLNQNVEKIILEITQKNILLDKNLDDVKLKEESLSNMIQVIQQKIDKTMKDNDNDDMGTTKKRKKINIKREKSEEIKEEINLMDENEEEGQL